MAQIILNIEKRYVFLVLGVALVLAGAVFVFAVVPNPGHGWGAVGDKPNFNQCAGNNQALKTLNLETGTVTCEADDAGGGGSLSGCSQIYQQAQQQATFNVPDKCKNGNVCNILIVSDSNIDRVINFRYVQQIGGVSISGHWFAEGGRSILAGINNAESFAAVGVNGDSENEIVADGYFGLLNSFKLLDDGSSESSINSWTLTQTQGGNNEYNPVTVYLCDF